MKRILIIASTVLCTSHLISSDPGDAGYRQTYPSQVGQIEQLSIAPKTTRKGKMSYGDTSIFVSARVSSTETEKTNILLGARRLRIGLGSKIQPRNTNYALIGCNTEYTGIESWDWLGNLIFQPQASVSNIARRMRSLISLDGRYEMNNQTGLHVGFYIEAGMRATLIRPLLGFDYTVGAWQFQAVYPIKAGISYQGFKSNLFSLMFRPLSTTVRAHKGLHNRPSIIGFKANGLEFRYDFLPTPRWNFWASIGQTLGGSLEIGDKNNNHKHHVHTRSAPYANIGLSYMI